MNSIKLNKHGNNAAIKYHILTEDKMKKLASEKLVLAGIFLSRWIKEAEFHTMYQYHLMKMGVLISLMKIFVSHTIMNTYWREIRILVLLK